MFCRRTCRKEAPGNNGLVRAPRQAQEYQASEVIQLGTGSQYFPDPLSIFLWLSHTHHEAGEVQGYFPDRVSLRLRFGVALLLASLLIGCQGLAPQQRPISTGHVGEKAPTTPAHSNIPAPVRRTAFVPKPVAAPPVETYTVVVNDVPVKELLFALARDAAINVDIYPDVSGLATLNAVDQSLEQILDRVARQLDLRYEFNGDNVSIQRDGEPASPMDDHVRVRSCTRVRFLVRASGNFAVRRISSVDVSSFI